jgi:EAL domain-containing protein (putative c-di-GMP-specific phosphodiesterase class I)
VRLAIDDFGTGYSSLNYLRQFPIDVLKIDRSFIEDLTTDGQVFELTAAIIGLARVLGVDPVAEGIETAEQLDRLRALGCPFGQGFHFHRPIAIGAAEELVIQQAKRSAGPDASRNGQPDSRPAHIGS